MIQLLPSGSFRHVRVGKMFNIIQNIRGGTKCFERTVESLHLHPAIHSSIPHSDTCYVCDLEHDARGTAGEQDEHKLLLWSSWR